LLYIGRFAIILIGYAVAMLAASAFLHLLCLGAAGFQPDESSAYIVGPLLFSVPLTALFVGYFAFLPFVVAILVGEVMGQRNWLFYALAGAAVGLVVVALFWQSPMGWDASGHASAQMTLDTSRFVGAMIGSGIVGGLAYWLCAGRSAGSWRGAGKPDQPTASGPSGS
jgi:hypothetical protein